MMCNTGELLLLSLFMIQSQSSSFFESLNWKFIAIYPVLLFPFLLCNYYFVSVILAQYKYMVQHNHKYCVSSYHVLYLVIIQYALVPFSVNQFQCIYFYISYKEN